MTGEGHTGEDVKKEKPSESLAGSSPPPLPSRLSAACHLAENGSHCVTRTPILPDSEASMLNVRPVSPDFIFPLVPSLSEPRLSGRCLLAPSPSAPPAGSL